MGEERKEGGGGEMGRRSGQGEGKLREVLMFDLCHGNFPFD